MDIQINEEEPLRKQIYSTVVKPKEIQGSIQIMAIHHRIRIMNMLIRTQVEVNTGLEEKVDYPIRKGCSFVTHKEISRYI